MEEDKEQESDGAEQVKGGRGTAHAAMTTPNVTAAWDDDMDEDDESERSYDGSDAECYYELKEERKARSRRSCGSGRRKT